MVKKIESRFLNAEYVATILGVSVSSAYRIIRELNKELDNQGKITIAGKISKRYFEEKVYL
jgi:transposase